MTTANANSSAVEVLRRSGRDIAAAVIYLIAAVLLLLPVYEWLTNSYYFFLESREYALLLLNLPARLFALVGFVLMFFQFVLGMRLPAFEKVFSRAVNLKRHRALGKAGFILILLHGLMFLLYDYLVTGGLLFDPYRVVGMIALAVLIPAVIAAWHFKRLKLSRSTWRTLHLLAYVVFPLGFVHGRTLGVEFATGTWTVNALFSVLLAIYVLLLLYRLVVYLRG